MPRQKKATAKALPASRQKTKPAIARSKPLTAEYRHQEEAIARPDVGTQPQFRKKAPPKTYRYDSSLAPALEWDGGNPSREQGEALLARAEVLTFTQN